jgi:hypothetical protein
MDANEKLVSVYTASTPGQVDIARLALEEAGIQAAVTSGGLENILGFAAVGAHGLPNVMVAERDVEAAKSILDGLTQDPGYLVWDKSTVRGPEGQATESAHAEPIDAWPLCPACHKPRLTICPVCSTSGSDFPRAHENFNQDEAEAVVQVENAEANDPLPEQRLAVICTTCDEPWLARFLRRCEWCGHDFGVGLKVDYVPPVREHPDPINPRAVFLVVLMVGGMAGVLAWFWMLGK